MRNRDTLLIAAALVASVAGCLRNPDPAPRRMSEVLIDTHGGYAVVVVRGAAERSGELIAIDDHDVWILERANLLHVPLAQVSKLDVHPYAVSTGAITGWGVLGTLSTVTHGYFLILSAPVWIISSVAIGAGHSRTAVVRYPGDSWQQAAEWARFPQGMPPGMSATELIHGRPTIPATPRAPPATNPRAPAVTSPVTAPATPSATSPPLS